MNIVTLRQWLYEDLKSLRCGKLNQYINSKGEKECVRSYPSDKHTARRLRKIKLPDDVKIRIRGDSTKNNRLVIWLTILNS